MDEDGTPIIKLDIGNLASFGFDPPAEIVQAIVRNLPHTAGYTDSKGLLASREAVVRYAQQKAVTGATVEDIYLGDGVSASRVSGPFFLRAASMRFPSASKPAALGISSPSSS
jgi:aspartate/methionine/tyrosine aminotransferase